MPKTRPAIVFLPPAPHTGAFFDTIRSTLGEVGTLALTYPGYGDQAPIAQPSIRDYAEALVQEIPKSAVLVGFHTGNLVAAEIAKRKTIAKIVMIDIPYFDQDTRDTYAAKLPDDPEKDAFRAAFAYDPFTEFSDIPCSVSVIATQSNLLDPTRNAAKALGVSLTERMDVTAPVFEAHAKEMAAEILSAIKLGDEGPDERHALLHADYGENP